MDIRELAERLRPFHYDFLVFNACFMSSIEVLYEMRNSFDYIVSSPTEVLATGFPYKEILPELLNNSPNYSEIVEKYIAQYNEKKGVLKSASMTVVKTSVLKSFSESLKELINHDVTVPDISTILQYDQEATSWLFDIGGFVSLLKNSERKESVIKLGDYIRYYPKYTKHCLTQQIRRCFIYNNIYNLILDIINQIYNRYYNKVNKEKLPLRYQNNSSFDKTHLSCSNTILSEVFMLFSLTRTLR